MPKLFTVWPFTKKKKSSWAPAVDSKGDDVHEVHTKY